MPHLPFPHSSQVDGEPRKLRCHMGSELPPGEIKIAQKRWEDFKARMDARRRKPPRAAGRDAP